MVDRPRRGSLELFPSTKIVGQFYSMNNNYIVAFVHVFNLIVN